MENFDFCSPTHFVFGKDREREAGSYVKKYGGSRVLVHFGGQSAKKSGLLDRVTASLQQENLEYALLGGVKPNPRSGLVYEGIELCREKKIFLNQILTLLKLHVDLILDLQQANLSF